MAEQRPTHTMVHPNQYMRVNGHLQKIEKGTPLTLNEKQAKRFGKKVEKIGGKKTVDVSGSADK